MFIEPPRSRSLDEIYQWCIELAEKINRELIGCDIEKENKNNGDKKA